jgi:hypothetical protein
MRISACLAMLSAVIGLATLAKEVSVAPTGYRQGGNLYRSVEEACAAYVRSDPGARPGKAPEYEGHGDVRCHKIRSDKSEDSLSTVSVQCPERSAPSGIATCLCEGGSTTAQQSGAPAASEQQALRQWMGKKFTDVPALNAHWIEASKSRAAAVRTLKPDPKTNQANRRTFFNPVREQFWKRVFSDEQGARKLLEDAGAKFTTAGKPPTMVINGRTVVLDVDHIVGLAVEPSRMLDSANLQLVSSVENQRSIEETKREDPFQSPQAQARWEGRQGGNVHTCP